MTIDINTNIASIGAQRNLSLVQQRLQQSMEQLSSGNRINRASDDSGGLAISEGMRSLISSMGQSLRNANDGISMVQTADGALSTTGDTLSRMRELAVQSANGALNPSDRSAIATEFNSLRSEIDRVAGSTEFNGKKLLDGSMGAPANAASIQVGTGNNAAQDRISVQVDSATSSALGVDSASASVDTQAGAQNAIASIDTAIQNLSSMRSDLGATQNRLQSSISSIQTSFENTSAAESRIRSTDVAAETANMVNAQILSSAGIAILAQANIAPKMALSLMA